MNFNLTLIYLTCAIIISSIIGIYSWRHRESRGCKAFSILILFSILWMSGSIFYSQSDTLTTRWIGRAIQFLGIPGVPVALLVFVYQYCGKTIRRRSILLLGLIPLISWFVLADPLNYILGNLSEDLKPTTFNLRSYYFWWIHVPYCYILLAASLSTVFFEISHTPKRHREQVIILFVAVCFTTTADLLGLLGVLGETNLSPLSFLIFFILMAISIVRYQFLRSNPIAYEIVFQTIRDGVVILDRNDIIRDINAAALERLEKNVNQIVGSLLDEAFASWNDLIRGFHEKKSRSESINMVVPDADRFISIDVTPIIDIDGTVEGRILTLRDVTEHIKEQKLLEKLAFHDSLTQLANRRKFDEAVELAIADFSTTGRNFAILYLDLDRFKAVNDTMGHEVGDEMLKYVARRLNSTVRDNNMLARIGGDEFAILLHGINEKTVQQVMERILKKVERPFKVGEYTLTAEISIGTAIYPENGSNMRELMHYADSAMYRAKSQGGRFHPYNSVSELEM